MTIDMLNQNMNAVSSMGMQGELFVLQYEKKRLPFDMHSAIQYNAQKDVAFGYDIVSFETPESVKPDRYIEVKTYRGHKHFYWSEGEITIARLLSEHYYLYLVDYDRLAEDNYQPEIIQNPARLFESKDQWISQPTKYVFSELSPENIPADWFESIILVGCYNTPSHLQWILANGVYNVRSRIGTARHGEVDVNDHRVQNAHYLLLYQIGVPQNFLLFELTGKPRLASQNEMWSMGYATAHSSQYVLHTISRRLPDFYVNLQQLFREALPKMENSLVGQPLYLSGRQLTNFMPQRPDKARPISIDCQRTLMLEKRGTLWSVQEDNQLLAHLKDGLPLDEISSKMFRTVGSIKGRMKRLLDSRLIPRDLYYKYIPPYIPEPQISWTKEMDDYIVEAFRAHVEFSDMAQCLGIKAGYIIDRLTQLGILVPRKNN